jgi:hypothetical protein
MTKADLKKFLLQALKRMDGAPMPDAVLIESGRQAFKSAAGREPSVGDINEAKRELEHNGYIHGTEDEMDHTMSWTLTPKGKHKVMQI